MPLPPVSDCEIAKLPSGVYEVSWISAPGTNAQAKRSAFYTKAQLLKASNSGKTIVEIREFLRAEFRSGETIK